MIHSVEDALLTITRAFPAQNTNANSSAIDLLTASPEWVSRHTNLLLNVPATTTATGQTITITFQDSADNSSFAAITGLSTIVLTGASNATAALERVVVLPTYVRRYVRMNIAMSATTGDQTALSTTLKLRA
jgi:hypothetical protein